MKKAPQQQQKLSTHSAHCLSILPYATHQLPKVMQYFYQFLATKQRLFNLQQRLQIWDTKGSIAVNNWSQYALIRQFFKVLSRLGDGWFWAGAVLIMVAILIYQKLPYELITIKTLIILLSSGAGYRLYKLLKVHTVRPRPYQVHQVIILGERPLDVFSFPSGHTLQAVLFTVMIGSQVPDLLVILLPFTLLIAISRLVLGLHYPSDVLVGAAIGLSFAVLGNQASSYLNSHYLSSLN